MDKADFSPAAIQEQLRLFRVEFDSDGPEDSVARGNLTSAHRDRISLTPRQADGDENRESVTDGPLESARIRFTPVSRADDDQTVHTRCDSGIDMGELPNITIIHLRSTKATRTIAELDMSLMPESSAPSDAPPSLSASSYVRTQWHEFSGRPDELLPLDEYFDPQLPDDSTRSGQPSTATADSGETHRPAWEPFGSYEDFTFAEYVASTRLSSNDVNNLLNLMRNVWCKGSCLVSFKNHNEMSQVVTPLNSITVPVSVDPIAVFETTLTYSVRGKVIQLRLRRSRWRHSNRALLNTGPITIRMSA
jgi:hypothetical protein